MDSRIDQRGAAAPPYSLERGFVAFDNHDVRVVIVNGQPAWHAGDVAAALGYRDANCILRLVEDDPRFRVTHEVCTPGGLQMAAWLTFPGLCDALSLSRRPRAKQMRRWLTCDVMPAIATQGYYLHPEAQRAGVRVVGAPDTTPVTRPAANTASKLELLLRRAADELAERDRMIATKTAEIAARDEIVAVQSQALALAAPKADAWDVLVAEGDDFSVAESSKILARDHGIKLGRNRLHRWLIEHGMVYLTHDSLGREVRLPYQRHVDLGRIRCRIGQSYAHPRTGERLPGRPELRLTAKGIAYCAKRMKEEK